MMGEYTDRKNINRGYMKLDVWKKSIELYKEIGEIFSSTNIDFKIRSQIANASQSVTSNIAEGYRKRSLKEYIQFLYIALASLSGTLTRLICLKATNQISETQFQKLDTIHYEVENKLLRLIDTLEKKKEEGTWIDRISEDMLEYNP